MLSRDLAETRLLGAIVFGQWSQPVLVGPELFDNFTRRMIFKRIKAGDSIVRIIAFAGRRRADVLHELLEAFYCWEVYGSRFAGKDLANICRVVDRVSLIHDLNHLAQHPPADLHDILLRTARLVATGERRCRLYDRIGDTA